MPPAAPTGLTVTPGPAGDPKATIAWSHTGVDLHRFEVLHRKVGTTPWTTYVLGPKADFNPSGTNYSIVVSSLPNYQWLVQAVNAAGEVSV